MVAERKPRAEAYPDSLRVTAACGHPGMCGCSVAQCCISCPLAQCRFDGGGADVRQVRSSERRELIVGALRRGARVNDITVALGVSRRTVFRLSQGVERPMSRMAGDRSR